jgi:ABC-type dipeptide/oligopeptide/nickel transport system permease component
VGAGLTNRSTRGGGRDAPVRDQAILYSIVVLFVASFLTFTFVAISGDPLAPLRITPSVSQQTIENVTERKHLDEPVPVRYWYWLKDAVTNQFGTTLLGEK